MENTITVLMPVPESAPEPDTRHPKHGDPSASHAYRDENGELLFYVCRFEPSGGAKQFAPLVCVQYANGSLGWAWKAPPTPRPLYGLDELAAKKAERVLIVEGEKAADAARLRFPSMVVMTWMSGANSVGLSDFTVLAERDVVLWPDNDKAGREAMHKVAAKLVALRAKSVVIVEVPTMWPKSWDLADVLPPEADEATLNKLLTEAATYDEWPDLDLSMLAEGRPNPPPFPVAILGPWKEWIASAAESKSAPVDYVVMPLLVAAGSLIGNSRVAQAFGEWTEPPVLWGANVGEPSSGKSPATDPITSALRSVQRNAGKDFDQKHREWEAQAAAAKFLHDDWREKSRTASLAGESIIERPANTIAPDEPKLPRLQVHDVTPEAVPHLAAANPRGLALFRDELNAWLNSFDRYTASSAQAFWIELYGARPFTVDRVPPKLPIQVPRFGVCVFGNIQPDPLQPLLNGANDGMLARFLFAWPNSCAPKRPSSITDLHFIKRAFERLYSIPLIMDCGEPQPYVVPLEPQAEDLFQQWRETHANEEELLPRRLKSAYGKYPGIVLRLALVIEHLWWSATDSEAMPVIVTTEALDAAIKYIEEYAKPMLARVYGSNAVSPAMQNAAMILRYILRTKRERLNKTEIRDEARLPGLYDAKTIQKALDVLVEGGFLRQLPDPQVRSVGRPRADYLVNPKLLAFSENPENTGNSSVV